MNIERGIVIEYAGLKISGFLKARFTQSGFKGRMKTLSFFQIESFTVNDCIAEKIPEELERIIMNKLLGEGKK